MIDLRGRLSLIYDILRMNVAQKKTSPFSSSVQMYRFKDFAAATNIFDCKTKV